MHTDMLVGYSSKPYIGMGVRDRANSFTGPSHI